MSTLETCLSAWEGVGMGKGVLALDNILSAVFFFTGKWCPELKGNQSRDLLRFLLCRLYDQSRGQVVNAQLTLAQGTLARKLGLSRQWVGALLERLQETGWIEYYAPVLSEGMRGSTIFRAGRQLKRLLLMLLKSKRRLPALPRRQAGGRQGKSSRKPAVNNRWQFSPSKEERRHQQIRERENTPPSPELLKRIPLLRRWLDRGKAEEQGPGDAPDADGRQSSQAH
jgi:DNA-binding Lrp family transcriptional regulator